MIRAMRSDEYTSVKIREHGDDPRQMANLEIVDRLVRETARGSPERVCQAVGVQGADRTVGRGSLVLHDTRSPLRSTSSRSVPRGVPGGKAITGRARLAVPAPPVVNERHLHDPTS
jgi:hypothetical protein